MIQKQNINDLKKSACVSQMVYTRWTLDVDEMKMKMGGRWE